MDSDNNNNNMNSGSNQTCFAAPLLTTGATRWSGLVPGDKGRCATRKKSGAIASTRATRTTMSVAPAQKPSSRNDKEEVEEYFNGTGFARWNRIYSDVSDVNGVQKEIRRGHEETVETILRWLSDEETPTRIVDAGCGVGSLSNPLAQRGHSIYGVDISAAMVAESQRRSGSMNNVDAVYEVCDLEKLGERGDIVCCVDVLIHYSTEDAVKMIKHLAALCERRFVLSFAPSTPWLDTLKVVGGFFPGPSKATRAYLHREQIVRQAIEEAGFRVNKSALAQTKFYYSQILDCTRRK